MGRNHSRVDANGGRSHARMSAVKPRCDGADDEDDDRGPRPHRVRWGRGRWRGDANGGRSHVRMATKSTRCRDRGRNHVRMTAAKPGGDGVDEEDDDRGARPHLAHQGRCHWRVDANGDRSRIRMATKSGRCRDGGRSHVRITAAKARCGGNAREDDERGPQPHRVRRGRSHSRVGVNGGRSHVRMVATKAWRALNQRGPKKPTSKRAPARGNTLASNDRALATDLAGGRFFVRRWERVAPPRWASKATALRGGNARR
mmetsp:Transcript_32597/g.114639  ORF Transcript_32597/g.114639 Transcript_32597/m.114639 type:complete len:258 (-) Transcript_32597:1766-2539(-)